MPDLITHVSVVHLLVRFSHPFHRVIKINYEGRWFLYLGTILPDLFTRPLYILFPPLHHWIIFFHTPFAMIIMCLMLTVVFTPAQRSWIFTHLSAGVGMHFLLDAFQKQVIGNNFWLYPISYHDFGFSVIWAHDILYAVPWLLATVLATECYFFLKKRLNGIE